MGMTNDFAIAKTVAIGRRPDLGRASLCQKERFTDDDFVIEICFLRQDAIERLCNIFFVVIRRYKDGDFHVDEPNRDCSLDAVYEEPCHRWRKIGFIDNRFFTSFACFTMNSMSSQITVTWPEFTAEPVGRQSTLLASFSVCNRRKAA